MDQLMLVEELRGPKCRCNAEKQPSQTFCRKCYFSLPKHMQQALYNRIGEGYEEAYDRAVKFLTRPQAKERDDKRS